MPKYYEQKGHPDSIALAKKYGERMLTGELTNTEFAAFADPSHYYDFSNPPVNCTCIGIYKEPSVVRYSFIPDYGFFVATKEWIEWITCTLKNRQPILEVCAGTGTLAKIMSRHLRWIATDKAPPNDSVETLDAIAAIEKYKPATVFASWIDYESELDIKIAKLGLPFVLIGENGGCTGSELFWDKCNAKHASEIYPDFVDTVSWYGIYDTTWLVNWH